MWNVIPKTHKKITNKEVKDTGSNIQCLYVIYAFVMPVSSGGAEVKACK